MTNYYIDFENGDNVNDGLSWGNAWYDLTNASAVVDPGDNIYVAKSPDPVYVGSATMTQFTSGITLGSAVTKTIDNCETAWTLGKSGTAGTVNSTRRKQGTYSIQVTTDTATNRPINSKLVYKTLSSTLDLSGYQRICMWLYNPSWATDYLSFKLCSDTSGDTALVTFTVYKPEYTANNSWHPIVLDYGSNLPSNVNSIAFYKTSLYNSATFYVDNIFATTTNGLAINDLISVSSSAVCTSNINTTWFPISYIDETNIAIDLYTNSNYSTTRTKYCIEDGTYDLYKRSVLYTPYVVDSAILNVTFSGDSSSNITISGGYDTSNNEQNGETFFTGYNTGGKAIEITSSSYITIEHLCPVNFDMAIYLDGSDYITTRDIGCIVSCLDGLYLFNSSYCTIDDIYNVHGGNNSLYIDGSSSNYTIGDIYNLQTVGMVISGGCIGNIDYIHNVYYGWVYIEDSYLNINTIGNFYESPLYIESTHSRIKYIDNVTVIDNDSYAIEFDLCDFTVVDEINYAECDYGYAIGVYNSSEFNIRKINTINNSDVGMDIEENICNIKYPTSLTATTPHTIINSSNMYKGVQYKTSIIDYNNESGRNYTVSNYGDKESQTTIRKRDTGYCWKMTPDSNSNDVFPLKMQVTQVCCQASSPVTVTCWFRRSDIDLHALLFLEKNQISGVTEDVYDEMTASIDTWEKLSISFTPTETGVVTINACVWGSTGSVYVDEVEITQ